MVDPTRRLLHTYIDVVRKNCDWVIFHVQTGNWWFGHFWCIMKSILALLYRFQTAYVVCITSIAKKYLRTPSREVGKGQPKGQTISEWIYKVIVSPKIRTKNCQDCPVLQLILSVAKQNILYEVILS